MATTYEILRDTGVSGPYTGATLRQLAAEGRLRREDRIRLTGGTEWYPAGRSTKLFPAPGGGPSPSETSPLTLSAETFPDLTLRSSAKPGASAPAATGAPAGPGPAAVSGRPSAGMLALAAVVGVCVAVPLSSLKPGLGAAGLAGVVGGLVVALAATVLLMRSAVTPPDALGRDAPGGAARAGHPAVAAARSRVARVAWLGGLCLAPPGVGSLAEFLTPPEGLTRTALAQLAPPPPPPPPPLPASPALDAKAWAAAQFVLVNPGQDAVAVRYNADPQAFHVLALVPADRVREATKLAVANGVQIIEEKPDLARRVALLAEPGRVPDRLAGELAELWRVHQYLPPKATLVKFQDVREGKTRVGFLIDSRAEEITFIPLAPRRAPKGEGSDPFVSEVVRRADVRTGFQRVKLTDGQARESADFLDFSVYKVLDKLSTAQRGAGYVRVVIEPVTYDDARLAEHQGARRHALRALPQGAGHQGQAQHRQGGHEVQA